MADKNKEAETTFESLEHTEKEKIGKEKKKK